MDEKKERRKQYYLENRERILEKNKKYYYDNIEIRKEYNRKYWETHKDKYLKQRSKDEEYKTKHRLYYQTYYKERNLSIEKQIKMNDITIYTNNSKELTVYFN